MRCEQSLNDDRLVQKSLLAAVLQKTIEQPGQIPSIQCFCSMVYPNSGGHRQYIRFMSDSSIKCTLVITRCPLYITN